jgi:3-phosphoshikimate 1-carboxyvinyltransferase
MTNKQVVKAFPGNLKGSVNAPSSKSLTHRALICASLSRGESVIRNVNISEDIIATMNVLKSIGAKFTVSSHKITVKGVSHPHLKNKVVDCNESGSTLRFLIPVLSLTNKEVHFTGKDSLLKRPMDIYQDVFDISESTFIVQQDKIVVNGSIKANEYILKGDVSSQFFSGLLFALPLLKENSTIIIDGNLESKAYVDLTIAMLQKFGIVIKKLENGYFIKGNQQYKHTDVIVEGDYSQAAFYLVAGVISGKVHVQNLTHNSKQGDKAIIDIIQSMDGKVVFMENGFVAEQTSTNGEAIDISETPDLGPIVCLLGALSKGTTTIKNIERLRIKESDRVKSTIESLSKLGANIKEENGEIIIHGKKTLQGGVTVDSYNDHRIAMMLSIAALRCEQPITITNAIAVNKSYPHFYEDYKQLKGKIE